MKAEQLALLYRKDEATNPEAIAAAWAAVFSDYPQHLVTYACDPRTGVASKCKFIPSVAEVKEFLDGLAFKEAQEEERRARAAKREAEMSAPEYREWRDNYNRRYGPRPLNPHQRACIFCAETNTEFYEPLAKRHIETNGRESFVGKMERNNGWDAATSPVGTLGLWVPQEWIDDVKRGRAGLSPKAKTEERPAAREIEPDLPLDQSPPLEAYADALSASDEPLPE